MSPMKLRGLERRVCRVDGFGEAGLVKGNYLVASRHSPQTNAKYPIQ